jgi:transcription-repair coupling factor (superfamily II helicase)
MRDLEIRGAGNLLGVEQSGNMDAVGYDLYMKLVEEAVHELKMESEGKPVTPIQDLECQIDIDLQAILPDEYVSDESLRVNLYKRLASIHAVPLVDRFEMELKDRFGPLPKHAENLMEMTRMKILGQEKGFKRIIIHKNRLDVFFHDKHVLKYSSQEQFAQYLRSMIDSSKMPFQFQQKKEFGLKLQISEHDVLAYSIKFLQSIA